MPRKGAPSDPFERMLEYRMKHSAWIIFRSIYWAIYLLLIGGMLLYYTSINVVVSMQTFFGFAFATLAFMIIIYGIAEILHHKLMKKYA
jgi:hypothetical protein